MDMMMFATKDERYAYDKDDGQQKRIFRVCFIHIIFANAHYDLLNLLKTKAAGKEDPRKPKLLWNKTFCDLLENQLDAR